MKATISKQLSEGEVLVLEMEAKNPEEMAQRLAATWHVVEQRPRILIERIKDAHAIVTTFPAAVQQAVHACLGLLHGKPGMEQQLQMAKEVIDRDARDLARLKTTYEPEAEPEPEPAQPEPPSADLSEADLKALDRSLHGTEPTRCAVCGSDGMDHDANAHREAAHAAP